MRGGVSKSTTRLFDAILLLGDVGSISRDRELPTVAMYQKCCKLQSLLFCHVVCEVYSFHERANEWWTQ